LGGRLVCAQAVLSSDTPVLKKFANHIFYFWMTVWGLP
jgi:hypothetical protein